MKNVKAGTPQNDAKEKRLVLLNVDYSTSQFSFASFCGVPASTFFIDYSSLQVSSFKQDQQILDERSDAQPAIVAFSPYNSILGSFFVGFKGISRTIFDQNGGKYPP